MNEAVPSLLQSTRQFGVCKAEANQSEYKKNLLSGRLNGY